jgi:predicted transcriptional regulator
MEALWSESEDELTVRQVTDEMGRFAYTTVATVLDRLVHKGLVRRRLDGRTIRFTAVGSSGAHTALLMHEALAATSDRDAALAEFADTLTTSEAAVLRKALGARARATSS